MRNRNPISTLAFVLSVLGILAWPASVVAQCPENRLVNPGFEEGEYKTEGMGTSLSSAIANGWAPWSILGDATINREVEYKVLHVSTLPNSHNIHSGARSQKYFTTWGTHTAGFYQRVALPRGTKVTFSIWVQIYTGERELESDGHFISDLEWSTMEQPNRGPGNYRVSIGIDPYGDTPPGFGAPPSPNTVWSGTINEFDTRVEVDGIIDDIWAQVTVSTIAQADYVTVYTKGQPEYPVKHNDSFWDDACLYVEAPPPPTAAPTNTPTDTPVASPTAVATATPSATATPLPPTATLVPPTATAVPATSTLAPTTPAVTASPAAPTSAPTTRAAATTTAVTAADPTPPQETSADLGVPGPILVYGGVTLAAIVGVLWVRLGRRKV